MNPLNQLAKLIRGDYFNPAMWRAVLVVVVISFTMVYSSASMDQKVYRLRKLSEEKNTLATQYVEIQSEISQVRMESGLLEEFRARGFEVSDQPASLIRVEDDK